MQKRTTLVVFLILVISTLTLTLRMILPYLLAVIMGGIFAILFQPAFRWLKSHHFKNGIASFVVTIGVVVLVIAPIAFLVSKAIQQGITIGQQLGNVSFQALSERIRGWDPLEAMFGTPEAFEAQARQWLQTIGAAATTTILSLVAQLPNLILQLVLTSITCFFFLRDGYRFQIWIADKIPLDSDVRTKVVVSFKNAAVSTIWATLAAAFAQSTVVWLGFLVLGIPAAFLAAGATFALAWVPIIGSSPVWVAGAIYLFVQGMAGKGSLMIVIGLLAGVVDNIVRPTILKGRSNIHPLVSLVAIFGGIRMFGIVGIFAGPILAALLISLLQIWPAVGSRFGLLPAAYRGPRPAAEPPSLKIKSS